LGDYLSANGFQDVAPILRSGLAETGFQPYSQHFHSLRTKAALFKVTELRLDPLYLVFEPALPGANQADFLIEYILTDIGPRSQPKGPGLGIVFFSTLPLQRLQLST
jgi:hypothetical protein